MVLKSLSFSPRERGCSSSRGRDVDWEVLSCRTGEEEKSSLYIFPELSGRVAGSLLDLGEKRGNPVMTGGKKEAGALLGDTHIHGREGNRLLLVIAKRGRKSAFKIGAHVEEKEKNDRADVPANQKKQESV